MAIKEFLTNKYLHSFCYSLHKHLPDTCSTPPTCEEQAPAPKGAAVEWEASARLLLCRGMGRLYQRTGTERTVMHATGDTEE